MASPAYCSLRILDGQPEGQASNQHLKQEEMRAEASSMTILLIRSVSLSQNPSGVLFIKQDLHLVNSALTQI